MRIFQREYVLKLRAAVISAGLVCERTALLSGIHAEFVASLPLGSTPGAQSLTDLDALNEAGVLADKTFPLAIWLTNVVALVGVREEATVFFEALGRCKALVEEYSHSPILIDATTPAPQGAKAHFFQHCDPLGSAISPPARVRRRLATLVTGLAAVLWATAMPAGFARFRTPVEPSYRGTLQHSSMGQPIVGADVILAGTKCVSSTDQFGIFDFGECADDGMRRLVDPRINIALHSSRFDGSGAWDCRDVPISRPPYLSDVRIDPDKCSTAQPEEEAVRAPPSTTTLPRTHVHVPTGPPVIRKVRRGPGSPVWFIGPKRAAEDRMKNRPSNRK